MLRINFGIACSRFDVRGPQFHRPSEDILKQKKTPDRPAFFGSDDQAIRASPSAACPFPTGCA
jgi:hypothetical protein